MAHTEGRPRRCGARTWVGRVTARDRSVLKNTRSMPIGLGVVGRVVWVFSVRRDVYYLYSAVKRRERPSEPSLCMECCVVLGAGCKLTPRGCLAGAVLS